MVNTANITISHDPETDDVSIEFRFHQPAALRELNPASLIALRIMDDLEAELGDESADDAAGTELLNQAAAIVSDRRGSYGDPVDFFEAVARRWALTLGMSIDAEQVVLCMLDLKHERLCRNPDHVDSILDTAGYAAILREVTA